MNRGISGLCLNSPSLVQMLEDADNGLFDEVMVFNFAHVSRRAVDVLSISKRLQAVSVDLTVLDSRFDLNSASGRIALQMMDFFFQYEKLFQEGSA